MNAAIRVERLNKTFAGKQALFDLGLAVQPGEMVALIGASGSGKSTLLRHLAGLACCDRSAGGRIEVLGREVQATGRLHGEVRRLRADIGYIFQQFNLLPFLTVRENACLPCHFSRLRAERARQRHGSVAGAAASLLEHLGLARELFERRAEALSIGQQQRVAAARALIGQPELVIADEPTSALDADSREAFLQLLFAECRAAGASLLFVSHDQSLAPLFDRSLALGELNRAARTPEI